MIKNFHPGDLWQNKKFLEVVQSHRKIKTFKYAQYSMLLYTIGPIVLKAKIYISRDFKKNDISALIENLHKFNALQIDIFCATNLPFNNHFENITCQRQGTYVVDLNYSKDLLFKNVSSKRRNQIRKGISEGVKISQLVDSEIFDKWWEIYIGTAARGGFTMQKKKLVWDALQLPECCLLTAWHDRTLLAGNVIFTNSFPFYWLGASDKQFPKFNAPSVLQWHIIEKYHEEGFGIYDMGGAEFDNSHGPSRFKKSMGPEFIEYQLLQIIPDPKLAALIKFGSKLYYKHLKRATW